MLITELIQEASLSGGIFKYQGTPKDRVPIVLDKIKNQSPFKIKTANGEEDIVFDPIEYSKVENYFKNKVGRLLIKAKDDDRMIPFGAIIKTKEFGGEESDKREKKEKGQIKGISKELEIAKNGKPYVNLQIGPGGKIVQAARVSKTLGYINGRQPKSDMTVYDVQDRPVAWISLKDAKFRWGGWLHMKSDPIISNWIAKVKSITNNVLHPNQSFGLHASDEIKNKIVFGKDFGSDQFGISNVNAVLIGWATVESNKNGAVLTSNIVYLNGQTPNGKDEPYLVIRYMKDRPDLGMKNTRAETNTKSETRNVQWLD